MKSLWRNQWQKHVTKSLLCGQFVAVRWLGSVLRGAKCLFRGGGQNFWVRLLFSKFSVVQKKMVIAPKWSNFLQLFCWSPLQKATILKTATRVRGVWVGMLGSLGGLNFCYGGHHPFLPSPLVAALLFGPPQNAPMTHQVISIPGQARIWGFLYML